MDTAYQKFLSLKIWNKSNLTLNKNIFIIILNFKKNTIFNKNIFVMIKL